MTSHADTALVCLSWAARRHGVDLDPDRLAHAHAIGREPVDADAVVRMATDAGLTARTLRLGYDELTRLGEAYPALARLANGNWVVVDALAPDDRLVVTDPLAELGEPMTLGRAELEKVWHGEAVLLARAAAAAAPERPFGISWFFPEILRQRKLFGEVALAALFLFALGLATPIFFQLVIDKVLVHESYTTLTVLAIGVAAALVFEAAFNFLRRYLLLFATNRIDVRTAKKTFSHLLDLPVGVFEKTSAGVLVKHMQQAGRIREFLTGRLFLTGLDLLSLLVFLPVLVLYSPRLTLVVLGFTGLIAVVVGVLVGPFRRRLLDLYAVEAERQAMLVETVHGMRTVKALAMEPPRRRAWEDLSAQAADLRFRVEKLSTVAQSLTGFLEKAMVVGIVGLGAMDVFGGTMTVGALVAFNMLAGRVTGPLMQVVTMVHEYQEVALSVRMLGEIMNRKPERPADARGLRPVIKGAIDVEDVTFRYADDLAPALDGVSLKIPAGAVVGIVGQSGSGKTTLTRLLQGFYPVGRGTIRIDGHDLREIDLPHLRRNVGVVLQESFLFRGTVRDNIACVRPDASIEEIALAARRAGAEEFIARLPRGFDTPLEENGDNLSGGQRQRLSIARALLLDPRILILDEATSALDPHSEAVVRQNLERIAEGRTVLIVSHRLATLVDADAIIVFDRGRAVEAGRHEDLLSRSTVYRHLWNRQTRHVA
jgi:subfamily B ATP-binding cassette protein HlyB/CyaB